MPIDQLPEPIGDAIHAPSVDERTAARAQTVPGARAGQKMGDGSRHGGLDAVRSVDAAAIDDRACLGEPANRDGLRGRQRNGNAGNAVKVWRLGAGGAPTLVDSIVLANISTVSDVAVSGDGKLLVFSAEGGTNAGVHVYSLADPEKPVRLGSYLVGTGVHTASLADIAGKRYVFAAKNPGSPALLILDITEFTN